MPTPTPKEQYLADKDFMELCRLLNMLYYREKLGLVKITDVLQLRKLDALGITSNDVLAEITDRFKE